MKEEFRSYLKKNKKNEIKPSLEKCCDNPQIELRDGNKLCLNCGLIHGRAFVSNERRAFTIQEVKNRKRTEPKWRDFGPRTVLPLTKKDSRGKSIKPKEQALFSRLSRIQNSFISSIERNFWEAKPKMKMIASKINLPDYITETAWKIYSIATKKKLIMGRSINGFISGSLYVAIRVHGFPRLLDEICDISLIPKKSIHKIIVIIIRDILPELGLKYQIISPESLIFRFSNELHLDVIIQKMAVDVLNSASKKGLKHIGKDPKGLAAACLYLVAKKNGLKITQTRIGRIAKITEVTLRSRIKQIKNIIM